MNINIIFIFTRFCVMYALMSLQAEHLTAPNQEEMISILDECLVMSLFLQDSQTQKAIYTVYKKIGIDNYLLGKYHKALAFYKKSLTIAKKIVDKEAERDMYEKLGIIHQSLKKYNKAIECHEKSIAIAKEIGHKEGEGISYGNLGTAYRSLRENHKAIECHEKSIAIAKEIGNRREEGRSYGNLGNAYESLREFYRAIQCHEKSIDIAKEMGNKDEEGRSYGNLGNVYQLLGEYHKAIECHQKSLDIAKEIDDTGKQLKSYMRLGNDYILLGKYHRAIEYHEKSLAIAEEIDDKRGQGESCMRLGDDYIALAEYYKNIHNDEMSLVNAKQMGDKKRKGHSYNIFGRVYQLLVGYHRAIEYHEKSLAIAEEIDDKRGQGESCMCLGDDYISRGEYHRAIKYLEKSLAIAKEIGYKEVEAKAYVKLGSAYQILKEYVTAIEYYEKGLSIDISNKQVKMICYQYAGNICLGLGEYHKAIEYLEKCLSIAKEIGNKEIELASYGNLGLAYQLLGEYRKAIKFHEMCLVISEKIGARNDAGLSYLNLGNDYKVLREYDKAIEYFEKSLSIAKGINDRQIEGNVYANLGNAYRCLGKYNKAIECQEKSLEIGRKDGERVLQAITHYNMGMCYKEKSSFKDIQKAKEHFQNSLEHCEKMFDDLKENDQFKISIFATFIECYKYLNEVLIESGQTDEALLVSERGRAGALGDLLSFKYNTAKNSKFKIKTIKLDDIKTNLSSGDSCILFYNLHCSNVHIWVITPQSESIFFFDDIAQREALRNSNLSENDKKKMENEYFQSLVESSFVYMNVRGMICEDRSLGLLEPLEDNCKTFASTPHKRNAYAAAEFDDDLPLEKLFDILVSPVLDKLTQDEIIIIPDGPLFSLPFAALQDPKTGEFLSETKRIRMAPSLTTLKILQESSDDHHDKSGALIIGNPATGKVNYKGKERSITFLQGAEDEAKEIGKLLGVQPLIGEQATKQRVLAELKQGVSVIHFAAHGSGKNGEIFLAPSRPATPNSIPEEEEYIFTMKEAQESGIRAQLVVLSCCHSGRGEIKSEGVVGMARAFLAAGARAVVASLWAIADQATMLFMIKFYSHLKKGESASTSLNQAMKEMREIEMYKEPKYWAAFFLIGDDVTINV